MSEKVIALLLFPFQIFVWFLRFIGDKLMYIVQTKYRWIVVIPIVLPLSLVYSIFSYIRYKYSFYLKSSPKNHEKKVENLVQHMKQNTNQKMCTGRSVYDAMSLFHAQYKKTFWKVDLSGFVDILKIDPIRRVVRVEPMVTCGQLTHTLLPRGWTLAVLPELDDLTVGGLIMGFGVETSSHKFGLFQYICESFEVALPGGLVVTCSQTENPDLFYTIPWSHGTIGFLLSAEIKIIPAAKYAQITYTPYNTQKEMLDNFEEAARSDNNDFVECLIFGPGKGVVMTGKMTDFSLPSKIHNLNRWWGPWFYKHVETMFQKGTTVEYIPLRDYYHRHTRSIFWTMEDIIPFGNNLIFRILFGWLIPPKVSFLKLTTTEKLHEIHVKTHMIEDFLVPMERLVETLDMQDKLIGFYPLWLCPCKIFKTPKRGLVNPIGDDDLYIDVGIYGMAPAARPENGKKFDYLECHHNSEQFIREIGGFQALYAQTYQTRKQFQKMFDHQLYNEVRRKYQCQEVFPELYDKVSLDARK